MAISTGSSASWADINAMYLRLRSEQSRWGRTQTSISGGQGTTVSATQGSAIRDGMVDLVNNISFLSAYKAAVTGTATITTGTPLTPLTPSTLATQLDNMKTTFGFVMGSGNGTFFSKFGASNGTFFSKFGASHSTYFSSFCSFGFNNYGNGFSFDTSTGYFCAHPSLGVWGSSGASNGTFFSAHTAANGTFFSAHTAANGTFFSGTFAVCSAGYCPTNYFIG